MFVFILFSCLFLLFFLFIKQVSIDTENSSRQKAIQKPLFSQGWRSSAQLLIPLINPIYTLPRSVTTFPGDWETFVLSPQPTLTVSRDTLNLLLRECPKGILARMSALQRTAWALWKPSDLFTWKVGERAVSNSLFLCHGWFHLGFELLRNLLAHQVSDGQMVERRYEHSPTE